MRKTNTNIKLIPSQEGEEIYFGKMPLSWLINYLSSHREYNKELTIKYIKDIYEMDLTKEIQNMPWWMCDINIYDEFTKEHPRTGYKTDSRDYFNNKGRNYYYKFINWLNHYPEQDYLLDCMKTKVVHHIFPLVYGGDNSLENLIHISDFNHELLHENPNEEDRKSCFKSVDYLWYLHNPYISDKNEYIVHKYKLMEIKNRSAKYQMNAYKSAIQEEMYEFYNFKE